MKGDASLISENFEEFGKNNWKKNNNNKKNYSGSKSSGNIFLLF